MKKTRLSYATAVLLLSASAALISACSSTGPAAGPTGKKRSKEYFAESIYGVKASPRVTTKRSRLKRGGGRDQLGRPYQIRGRWYYPKEEPGYVKVGQASWYGEAFHGRLTANGEIYDMTHLTAAHPTMPLPSYARVTNMKNGTSVIVRVNDRGPYERGRVIDLSQRAAQMLDYARDGTAKVKVEYVGRAPLDGEDEAYLVASYTPGNGAPDPSVGMPTGVMVAMNGSVPDGGGGAAQDLPGVVLPENGPPVLSRPGDAIAVASMSYGATPPAGAAAAFESVLDEDENAGWKQDRRREYVMVGAFRESAEARRLERVLSAYGTVKVETAVDGEGRRWHSLTLSGDGTTDRLLEAAWAAGASDAMTVRE